MTPNTYATLAIYSEGARDERITSLLEIEPTRIGEKRGVFSWLFSTIDLIHSNKPEDHTDEIINIFSSKADALRGLVHDGIEIRLWLYVATEEPNKSFVLSPELLGFLAKFKADVCVDIWDQTRKI